MAPFHHQHDELMPCFFHENNEEKMKKKNWQKGRASFQLFFFKGRALPKKGQGAAPCKKRPRQNTGIPYQTNNLF